MCRTKDLTKRKKTEQEFKTIKSTYLNQLELPSLIITITISRKKYLII